MSDGALDLSISSYEVPSQRASATRSHDHMSSDSGRASSDSTSSDIHDDVKPRHLTSSSPHTATSAGPAVGLPPLHAGPMSFPSSSSHMRDLPAEAHSHVQHRQRPVSSSPCSPSPARANISNPNSPENASSASVGAVFEEDLKPPIPSSLPTVAGDRLPSDARVAPIRPFKMYPVDPFNVYNTSLMAGAGPGGLSPSPVGIQSLYESSSSPSGFPSFPLTPLTSHLLQRKRRAESRDSSSGSHNTTTSSTTNTNNSASNSSGGGNNNNNNSVTSLPSGMEAAASSSVLSTSASSSAAAAAFSSGSSLNSNSKVSTSSMSGSGVDEDSNGSESEKKAKLIPEDKKDEAYWDRRRKNNEAAKRSRDARRQKEEEIAMRAAFLEQENLKLRAQVAILKNETAKLHYMLYNRI